MLLLNMFGTDTQEFQPPKYRLFISEADYIVQDMKSNSWKTCKIDRLLERYNSYYGIASSFFIYDDESYNLIDDMFWSTEHYEHGMDLIKDIQDTIGERRLNEKHQKETDLIDSQMALVPRLPKDFPKFVEDSVLAYKWHLLYNKGEEKAYCTKCRNEVDIKIDKCYEDMICPHCGGKVSAMTYPAFYNRSRYDQLNATIIQKSKDNKGLWIRRFIVSLDQDEYQTPKMNYHEILRIKINDEGKLKYYEWAVFKGHKGERWCNANHVYGCPSVLYTKNLKRVIKGTAYQYSGIEIYAKHNDRPKRFDWAKYLKSYLEFPFLEYLVKLGIYRITDDLLATYYDYGIGYGYCYGEEGIFNPKGKTIKEIFKIDKELFNTVRENDMNLIEMKYLYDLRQQGLNATPDQLGVFVKNNWREEFVSFALKLMSADKLINYVKSVVFNGMDFVDYIDYLKWCVDLRYDTKDDFILYPKDFRQRHDAASTVHAQYVKKKADEKRKKAEKKYKNALAEGRKLFQYQNEGLKAIVPKNSKEISDEGVNQHHCVENYTDEVLKGTTMIVFIRKKEDIKKSYYTCEISPKDGRIIQCRGKNNCSMTDKVEKFINDYSKIVKKRLEKENISWKTIVSNS